MDTTVFPWKIPAGSVARFVIYIGTLCSSSMCLTGMSASNMAFSKEKEHPITKVTKSSCHTSLRSLTSSTNSPFLYILYLGTSVLMSAPSAIIFVRGLPSSKTSRIGQGFGFL